MYKIAYGNNELFFDLPAGISAAIARLKKQTPIADVKNALSESLAQPIDSPVLPDLAAGIKRVAIAVTDASRSCPHQLLLTPILSQLHKAGIKNDNIHIIIAAGLHKASTKAEKQYLLSARIVNNYPVSDHIASDKNRLVSLGYTKAGIPISINKTAYESDLLISVGMLEPHQYAGYSGGSKTVAIGLAGADTICAMHSIDLLKQKRVALGNIADNPFRQALDEIAAAAGLKFCLNIIQNTDKEITHLAAGNPKGVFNVLAEYARSAFSFYIQHPYPIVIAGIESPKDANLYQLSRAAGYLAYNNRPAVTKGGVIILAGGCAQGIGEGKGEQGFYRLMRKFNNNPDELILRLETEKSIPGGQRAYVTAETLKHCRVIVVGSKYPKLFQDIGFIPADNISQAIQIAQDNLRYPVKKLLIVPQGTQTLIKSKSGF